MHRSNWLGHVGMVALLSSVALPATALAETYAFTGSSTSTSPTLVPVIPHSSGTQFTDFTTYPGYTYRYALYTFDVTQTGAYTVSATTFKDQLSIDNTTWIVLGSFNPTTDHDETSPIENFIVGVYSGAGLSSATIDNFTLSSGTTYSIFTAFNTKDPGAILTVDFTFDGPGCVLINGNICIDPAPPPQSGNASSNAAPGLVNIARGFGHAVSDRTAQLRAGSTRVGAAEDLNVLSFFPGTQSAGLDAIESIALSPAQEQALSLWGNVFGDFVTNRGNGAAPGFTQSAGGVIVGGDALVFEDLWVGLALGYAGSGTTGEANSGSATADNYHASLYANWAPGPWFATADLGLTFSQFQTQRPAVGATAEGRSHMLDTSIGGELGYAFELDGLTVLPSASLRYDLITAKGYTETGAGAANLTIRDATHHALRIGVGAEASKLFALNDDLQIQVSARARWEHDLLDTGYTTTQSISGADYQVSATDPGRNAAVLGLGTSAVFNDNLKLTLSYDAELRARQTTHSVTAGLRFTW